MSIDYQLRWLEEQIARFKERADQRVALADAEAAAANAEYERGQRERQARIAEQERAERDPIRAVVEHAIWVKHGIHPASERIREQIDPTPPPPPPTSNERPLPPYMAEAFAAFGGKK